MARTAKQKSAWRAKKKRYCVSAGAPGYGMKIQYCLKSKANATRACKALRSRGNRCKVIGGPKGGKKRCWCCPKKRK